MRPFIAFACAVMPLSGCGSGTSVPQTSSDSALSPTTPIALPPNGIVAHVDLPDEAMSKHWNDRLHFCVFDNGSDDWIYVGVRYGMWASGEFDLRSGQRLAFTGHVEHLGNGGTLIRMGDVIHGHPDSTSLRITRVTGAFK